MTFQTPKVSPIKSAPKNLGHARMASQSTRQERVRVGGKAVGLKIGLTFNTKAAMADELRLRGLPVDDDTLEEYDAEETIEGLADTLRALFGAEVCFLGWGNKLLDEVRAAAPDVVFNIAEGYGGRSREAQVPALLEMLGIPFVGSDPLALAVSLDKNATKAMVSSAGVTIPKGMVVRERCDVARLRRESGLRLPVVVKPVHEGSSRGITDDSLCTDDAQLTDRVMQIVEHYGEPAMVEEFIEGREVTVGLVGDPVTVLGVMEIAPKDPTHDWKLYSLEVKRNFEELALYTCPAALESSVRESLVNAALTAFHALGCKDMARVDFRVRPDGTPVFLEINPLPGLRKRISDFGIMSMHQSIPYQELIHRIVSGAFRRFNLLDGHVEEDRPKTVRSEANDRISVDALLPLISSVKRSSVAELELHPNER